MHSKLNEVRSIDHNLGNKSTPALVKSYSFNENSSNRKQPKEVKYYDTKTAKTQTNFVPKEACLLDDVEDELKENGFRGENKEFRSPHFQDEGFNFRMEDEDGDRLHRTPVYIESDNDDNQDSVQEIDLRDELQNVWQSRGKEQMNSRPRIEYQVKSIEEQHNENTGENTAKKTKDNSIERGMTEYRPSQLPGESAERMSEAPKSQRPKVELNNMMKRPSGRYSTGHGLSANPSMLSTALHDN
jgi:hypothetical protein